MMETMVVSYSDVSSYLRCPRALQLKRAGTPEQDKPVMARMTPEERAEVLAVIVTRDGAGRHFTEVWDWDTLNELEEAGLIYIDRPIHEPTGIPYSEEYYSVTVTEAGQELVDAYEADS